MARQRMRQAFDAPRRNSDQDRDSSVEACGDATLMRRKIQSGGTRGEEKASEAL